MPLFVSLEEASIKTVVLPDQITGASYIIIILLKTTIFKVFSSVKFSATHKEHVQIKCTQLIHASEVIIWCHLYSKEQFTKLQFEERQTQV